MLILPVCDRRYVVVLIVLCACIVVLNLERIIVSSLTTTTPAAPSAGGESADTSLLHLTNAATSKIVNASVNIEGTDIQRTIAKECTHVPFDITSGLLEWKPEPDK